MFFQVKRHKLNPSRPVAKHTNPLSRLVLFFDLEQQLLQPQEQNVAGVLGNGLQKDHQQIDAGFFKKQTAMQETPTQGQRKQEITQNRVRQHFTL